MSEQSISARDLLEAQLRAPRPTEDENNTAPGGQAQGSLNNGKTNDDDDDDELAALLLRRPHLLPPQDRGGLRPAATFGTRSRQACLL